MERLSAQNPSPKPATAYSCLRCFNRRVKCDKQQPCSACIRHDAECVFRVPPPPRRRKQRAQEEILLERLKRYEALLNQSGINPTSITGDLQVSKHAEPESRLEPPITETSQLHIADSTNEPERAFTKSKLLFDQAHQGRTKFVDNHLWTCVTDEFRDTSDVLEDSSDGDDNMEELAEDDTDFVLGLAPTSSCVKNLHPPNKQILDLWQIFLENVNPLTKVVHPPSLEHAIKQATVDLNQVPRSLETLMFVIYSLAVLSLKDDDCQRRFGEQRKTLLSRYRTATKAGLSRTKFMGTSNIVVLQAFYLHLLSMRECYDPRTMWTLTGVAGRIAEGMGLHRDRTYLGLPPFETEMRRRLWSQLKMLDYNTADLSGSRKMRFLDTDPNTTRPPSNVNDEDLHPEMSELPNESKKLTDMVLCALPAQISNFWTKYALKEHLQNGASFGLWDNYGSRGEIAEKDQAIDELEQNLESKFTRYCDPSQPEQLLASLIARISINNMRLIAHHPRRWSSEKDIPEAERQHVWRLSIKLLEANCMAQTNRQLQRFKWHVVHYFPWQPFIHVLDCLRTKPLTPEAAKAWQLVDEAYKYQLQLLANNKRPVHMAVGNLCLKAYHTREVALAKQGESLPKVPDYITSLRVQREAAKARRFRQETPRASTSSVAGFTSSLELPIHDKSISSSPHQPDPGNRARTANTKSKVSPLMNFPQQPTSSQRTGAFQNQTSTNDGAFWFWNENPERPPGFPLPAFTGDTIDMDVDFMFMQSSNTEDPNEQMTDWSQWDALLGGKSDSF